MVIKPYNEKIKRLREIILKEDKINEGIELCLELHSMGHTSEMSGTDIKTYEDELWANLDEKTFRTAAKDGCHTIAYAIWHITRIEDIAMNILVAGDEQVINTGNFIEKINSNIIDTGNALNKEEIEEFSKNINIEELKNYRLAVGRKTREIIKNLKAADMKRKMDKGRLKRILDEGAVANVEGANWLIDFWGRKNVAGLLLMPATRHQVVHINESISAKGKVKNKAR